MHSSRPYLARALYEWLLDNDQTPHIVVDAEHEGVQIPRQFVQNGQIVLNIAPTAVRELVIANEAITFSARFGGQPMQLIVPNEALIALYARENGVGMVFGHEPVMPEEAADDSEEGNEQSSERATLESVDSDSSQADQDGKADKSSRKEKPSLRVIK